MIASLWTGLFYGFSLFLNLSAAFAPPNKLFFGRKLSDNESVRCGIGTSRPNIITLRSSAENSSEEAKTDKSNDEINFITTALLKNSLFSDISQSSLEELVNGFEIKEAHRGVELVTQGDSCVGDYVYLVSEGECKVVVDGNTIPEPFGTVKPGAIFGELGVLYDESRAGTIRARTLNGVVYYRVSGELFKEVMQKPKEQLANMQAIDAAINQVSGTDSIYGGDVIQPYKPERIWLWQQFSGTVFKISITPTLANMFLCAALVVIIRYYTGEPLWEVGAGRPEALPLVQKLDLVGKIWDFDKTLVTFVLTFFLNQSFSFWKTVYQLARDVQGKLNDFNLLIATNVKRGEDGMLTSESEQLLIDISCYSSLFHILMWASQAKRFSALTSPDGLKRMESRGLMTPRQLEVLQNSKLPESKLCYAPLEWMMVRSTQAMNDGTLAGDTATKGMLLKQIVAIRGNSRAITDKNRGRMPLAYVNLVQVIVDTFVIAAPIALYSRLGDFSIVAVGTLTIFYTGLNNLAKIFLDPLNNENFSSDSIFMDLGVFLRETNGQAVQWKKAGQELPF